jgi:hypothetical protein
LYSFYSAIDIPQPLQKRSCIVAYLDQFVRTSPLVQTCTELAQSVRTCRLVRRVC